MSRQGTIRRYTLIIEKINRNQFPSFKEIQDYLFDLGFEVSKRIQIDSFLRFLEIVNTAELLTESLSESKNTLEYISFDKGGGLMGIELLKPLLKAIKEHRKVNILHFNFQTEKKKKYTINPSSSNSISNILLLQT